jgi:hypothetical protein
MNLVYLNQVLAVFTHWLSFADWVNKLSIFRLWAREVPQEVKVGFYKIFNSKCAYCLIFETDA